MSDLIERSKALNAINVSLTVSSAWMNVAQLPPAHQDDRLNKIAELVEGKIDHFDREDAMDLLYQIKEVLK